MWQHTLVIQLLIALASNYNIPSFNIHTNNTNHTEYSIAKLKINELSSLPLAINSDYLLPKTIRPIHYDLTIATRIAEGIFEFQGEAGIEIRVLEQTSTIVIHSNQLFVTGVQLFHSDRITQIEISLDINGAFEFLEIVATTDPLIPEVLYYLVISYNSVLDTAGDERGFYAGKYVNSDGLTKSYAATHFQPVSARNVFPCYDEPEFKATFKISIRHNCEYQATANTLRESLLKEEELCLTVFETTPVMSTYAVGFFVSDFNYFETADSRFTIFKQSDFSPHNFVFDTTISMINYMEQYFGVEFVLNKLNLIGLEDVHDNMEGWGINNYRTETAFYDELVHPKHEKANFIEVITHSMVYNWFGHLVTPERWGYLWLKEGFASYFGYQFVDRVFDGMKKSDMRIVNSCGSAKQRDAKRDAAPMTRDVYSKDEIKMMFDDISSDKAGCVMHMLLNALTEDRFRIALNMLLNERKYGTTSPDHFSNALNTAAHQFPAIIPNDINMKSVLDLWHLQAGIPVLNVVYNRISGAITLAQQRYTTDPLEPRSNWIIPYNFMTSSEALNSESPSFLATNAEGWLTHEAQTLYPTETRDWTNSDWILFNKQQTGYYRVNYDVYNWQGLIQALKDPLANHIHHMSRAQLIDDSFDFAANNMLIYDIPLELLGYLQVFKETDVSVWLTIAKRVDELDRLIFGSEYYSLFKTFIESISENAYLYIGAGEKLNEPSYNFHLRETLIHLSCGAGSKSCLTDTSALLVKHILKTLKLPDHRLTSIQFHGTRQISKISSTHYFRLWNSLYENTNLNSLQRRNILKSLANTENKDNLQLFLNSVLIQNGEEYLIHYVIINYTIDERNEIIQIIVNINPLGADMAMEFLKDPVNKAKILINHLKDALPSIFMAIAQQVKTIERLLEFNELLPLYTIYGIHPEEYLKVIENSFDWINGHGTTIKRWLEMN